MKKLSEDWLSVIIGLAMVVLIWINVLPSIPWPILGFLK
jgi:hypothetical protein